MNPASDKATKNENESFASSNNEATKNENESFASSDNDNEATKNESIPWFRCPSQRNQTIRALVLASSDNEATDNEATDNEATDNEATDNEATDNEATEKESVAVGLSDADAEKFRRANEWMAEWKAGRVTLPMGDGSRFPWPEEVLAVLEIANKAFPNPGPPQFEQKPLFKGPKKDRTIPRLDDNDNSPKKQEYQPPPDVAAQFRKWGKNTETETKPPQPPQEYQPPPDVAAQFRKWKNYDSKSAGVGVESKDNNDAMIVESTKDNDAMLVDNKNNAPKPKRDRSVMDGETNTEYHNGDEEEDLDSKPPPTKKRRIEKAAPKRAHGDTNTEYHNGDDDEEEDLDSKPPPLKKPRIEKATAPPPMRPQSYHTRRTTRAQARRGTTTRAQARRTTRAQAKRSTHT